MRQIVAAEKSFEVLARTCLDDLRDALAENHLHSGVHHVPAHDVERVGPEGAAGVKHSDAVRFDFIASHQHCGGAFAKKRRGDELLLEKSFC